MTPTTSRAAKVASAPKTTAAAASRTGSNRPRTLAALQRSAGNAAVGQYLQRFTASPGPVRPVGTPPLADPRFLAVTHKLDASGKSLKSHPAPKSEVAKAQQAAVPPAEDKEAQAKEAQSRKMEVAKPGVFDKAGFIAAVKAAIAAQAPKNLDEAKEFGNSGKAESVKGQVAGRVADGKAGAAKDITDTATAAPDTSKASEKPVTPLAAEPVPAAAPLNAAAAMPQKAPPEQTDLSGGPRDTNNAMAEADVTEEQLAKSNEPEFTDAVAAKKEGERDSAAAPARFREAEAAKLGAASKAAQSAGASGLMAMLGAKKGALGKSGASKNAAKAKDEEARAKVTAEVKGIFDATKTDVTAILAGLDGLVNKEFADGELKVRNDFTADLNARMDRYKDERYSGLAGAAAWVRDKFASLPPEAERVYVAAKAGYEANMEKLISSVADTIGRELGKAKDRIAKGRADITQYVNSRPKELQKVAQEAGAQFTEQFDQLESDVDSKKDALAQDLAAKYQESRSAVDEQITAMQDENKGLWDKAKDAVGGAITTILNLKNMLLNVLSRAAGAIEKIIKDPIGFLGNFINAVKGGILGFAERIGDHLKKGLQAWLLGALAEGGIELPEKFDLKGILQLVMSIFGLTWAHIRGRIVEQVGEPVMGKLEQGFEVVKVLVTEGVGGLWKWVLEKVGDIKEMVMGQIKEMVSVEIIKAGIVWLISLLNPASAFVKACKMIYDVVMFFVEKAAQIKEFVDAVLDSVESIAAGGAGAVAGYIEKTLAEMLPVMIGFLASLLGLGGISGKIKKILETIQKPVNKLVDWVVGKAVQYGKKFMGFAKKMGRKLKAKGKEMYGAAKKKLGIKEKATGRSEAARAAAKTEVMARLPHVHDLAEAGRVLGAIRTQLAPTGLRQLHLSPPSASGSREVVAVASPPKGLAKLAPWAAESIRKAQVAALVTVTFAQPPELLGLNFGRKAVRDSDGKVMMDAGGKPAMEEGTIDASRPGTLIRRPEAGSNELQFVSASGRTLRKNNNSSHAEFHAANLFDATGPIKGQVLKVHVQLKGFSPCGGCASGLATVANRVRQLNSAARLDLDCSGTQLYKPEVPGNFKSWDELRAAVPLWTLAPGKPVETEHDAFKVEAL